MTTEDTYNSLVQTTDKIKKAQKKIDPKYEQEIMVNLPASIKIKNFTMIQLYLATLEATAKEIENALTDVKSALLLIVDIEKDEEFISDRTGDMETLTGFVSDAQSGFAQQFEGCTKLRAQAVKALASAQTTQEQMFLRLADLAKEVNDEKTELKEAFAKSNQIATKAQTAYDTRDTKGLAEAQKAMDALDIDQLSFGYGLLEPRIKKFITEAEASGFEKDVIAELKDGATDALSVHSSDKVYVDQLNGQQKLVGDFKIGPIDAKKAAKELDIEDPKTVAALGKILNGPGPAIEKGLDALGKDLKPKTTGKQMVAALKKAGLW